MFANFKKIPTSDLHEYARQLRQASSTCDDINFPCGAMLRRGLSLRDFVGRNANQAPATLRCGEMLREEESAVCSNCHAEYKDQKDGDVESIPLRGLSEANEAEEELDSNANESGLTRFVKKHPYLAATFGILFAAGAVGAALGTYKTLQSGRYSTSTQQPATTAKPPTTKLSTTAEPTLAANTTIVAESGTTTNLTTTAEPRLATNTTIVAELEPTTNLMTTAEPRLATNTTIVTESGTTTSLTTIAKPRLATDTTIVAEPMPTTKLTTTAELEQTLAKTIEPATNQTTTTVSVTTQPSTTAPAINLTTRLTTAVLTTPKRVGVREINLRVHNYRACDLVAQIRVCGNQGCINTHDLIGATKEKGITFSLPKGYSSASVDYDFVGEEGDNMGYSKKVGTIRGGIIDFPKSDEINGYDINQDGKLEIRHSLLEFDSRTRIDEVFEDKNGMPKYSSVTTSPMKVVLDNRFWSRTHFALSGKRLRASTDYSQVLVVYYEEKNFPVGVNELKVGIASYPKKSFSGQQLNAALARDGKQTVCITSETYGAPTYLSDIKHGRCGH